MEQNLLNMNIGFNSLKPNMDGPFVEYLTIL